MQRARHSLTGEQRSPRRLDWTGISVLLLAASAVASGFVSRVIDGRTPITTSSGTIEYISHGHLAGYVSVALVALSTLVAILGILRSGVLPRRHTAFSALMCCALAWWLLCALLLRRDSVDRSDLPFDVAAAIVVLAVVANPMRTRTLFAFNILRDITTAVMFATSVANPIGSQIACRPDKCGIFGSLYTGFYYTENSAAQLVLLLVPAAITIRSRVYLLASLALTALFILATGSRTSLIGMLLTTVFVLLYRRRASVAEARRGGLRLWASIPLATFGVSTFAFLSYSGSELTGRGYIYAAIRDQLHGYALIIGSGPSTMQRAFDDGLLGRFEAIGEHGETSHLLVESGLVGYLLVAAALIALPQARKPWGAGQVAALGFALTAALQFVTEPGWTLDSRALNFATMLLAIALFRTDPTGFVHDRERAGRAGAELRPSRNVRGARDPSAASPVPRGSARPALRPTIQGATPNLVSD